MILLGVGLVAVCWGALFGLNRAGNARGLRQDVPRTDREVHYAAIYASVRLACLTATLLLGLAVVLSAWGPA